MAPSGQIDPKLASSLETKSSHGAKSHGGLILEAMLFLSGSKSSKT